MEDERAFKFDFLVSLPIESLYIIRDPFYHHQRFFEEEWADLLRKDTPDGPSWPKLKEVIVSKILASDEPGSWFQTGTRQQITMALRRLRNYLRPLSVQVTVASLMHTIENPERPPIATHREGLLYPHPCFFAKLCLKSS